MLTYFDLGIKTSELDNLIAETTAYLNILHPDYGKLAARVAVTKLHKETQEDFFDVIHTLHTYTETDRKFTPVLSHSEGSSALLL